MAVVREGCYNGCWSLYFGCFYLKGDERGGTVLVVGKGEGRGKGKGRTVYLLGLETWSLEDVARVMSGVKGREVRLKIVSREDIVCFMWRR